MSGPRPRRFQTFHLVARLLAAVAGFVVRRPLAGCAALLLLGGAALFAARGLTFDTSLSALLPEDTPELREVNRLLPKAGGTMELVVALEGKPGEARLAFGRRLVAALRKQPFIRRADVEFPVEFFLDRRLLLMDTKDLRELKEAVEEELQRARARANPLYVDLEEDDNRKKPWEALEENEKRYRGTLLKRTYTSPDGKYLFVRLKPAGTSYDMAGAIRLMNQIRAVVASLDPASHGIGIRYAGNLAENEEQHLRMTSDLRTAALLALGLIVALMTFHVRRLGAPIVIAVPLVVGVLATLAFADIAYGQLNLVTGFLVSALFGLGVDFEIHLYLRYLEELPRARDRREAMRRAVAATAPACVTAAMTTAASFYALAVSDFRGFREYGVIAGTGVLITLVVAFAGLPPVALALARRGRLPRLGATGRTPNLPRGVAWAILLASAAWTAYAAYAAPGVRWHTDFRKLRGVSEVVDFSYYVGDVLGGSLSPAGIFVRDIYEARRVEQYLAEEKRRPESGIKQYVSLASMVPWDVEEKLPILRELEASLRKALSWDLAPADRKKVEEALRLARVKPWGEKDIPPAYRRQFESLEGDGQFVAVWPSYPTHEDYRIIAWGAELERIRADLHRRGLKVGILAEARVSARVLREMKEDGPLVMATAGIAVILLLALDFRSVRRVALTAGALGVGVLWMLGWMRVLGIEINVFNQAVLATIIGVGIDNAAHIQHRYDQEGPGSVLKVMTTTGSAAFLASATTAIGFGTTIIAHHLGIRSLGQLSLVGLGSTFLASTVLFPAVLRVLEDLRRAGDRPR